MKHLAYALSFCIFLLSCNNSTVQDNFPDNIEVPKTRELKRVKGTKLFVSAPDSYQPIESMMRLQRDNNTYFQVAEVPGSNFNDAKSKLTKEAIESQGAKVDVSKPVKYNGYDALYFVGPSKTAGETKIMLAFGDKDFVVMLAGVCRTADKKGMEELNNIISASYYDKSFELDPMELTFFKFDESITGFKYTTSIGSMSVYTLNGKADLNKMKDDDLPVFQISAIEAPTFSKAKEFVDYMISRYKVQGMETSNIARQDITINGKQAYEVTLQVEKANSSKGRIYQVIIHDGAKAVLFAGSDTENGQWFDKFKATAQSIKW